MYLPTEEALPALPYAVLAGQEAGVGGQTGSVVGVVTLATLQ